MPRLKTLSPEMAENVRYLSSIYSYPTIRPLTYLLLFIAEELYIQLY